MEVLSMFVAIFLSLVSYVYFLQRKNLKNFGTFLNRSFPLVKWTGVTLPFIDGYITLSKLRTDGVKLAENLATKHGPTYQLYLASVKTVCTADPNLLHKVLNSTNTTHLNKPRAIYEPLFTDCLHGGLLVADVNIWSPHRKAISQSFTYKSFSTYFKFINEGAENLIKSACKVASQNPEGIIDNEKMKPILDLHAVKIVTHNIMGSECYNLSDEERADFHEHFLGNKEVALGRFLHPEQMVPIIWVFHPNKRKMDFHMKNINEFSFKIINKYRMKDLKPDELINQNSIVEKSDYEYYCNGSKSEDDGLGVKPFECLIEQMIRAGLSNKEIADEINTFMVTGQESILRAMDILLMLLGGHLEYQEKCRMEVDQLFETKNINVSNQISIDEYSELKYLERCILESLRIAPTVPFFLRQLNTPLQIKDDSVFEAGCTILANIWTLHRNPEFYPNPEVYDPERFLPENIKQRHPQAFLPFSFGVRNCVGWKVALLEIKVITAWILRHFEISTTDKLEDVKILFDGTLKPERMYNVSFKKRSCDNIAAAC